MHKHDTCTHISTHHMHTLTKVLSAVQVHPLGQSLPKVCGLLLKQLADHITRITLSLLEFKIAFPPHSDPASQINALTHTNKSTGPYAHKSSSDHMKVVIEMVAGVHILLVASGSDNKCTKMAAAHTYRLIILLLKSHNTTSFLL